MSSYSSSAQSPPPVPCVDLLNGIPTQEHAELPSELIATPAGDHTPFLPRTLRAGASRGLGRAPVDPTDEGASGAINSGQVIVDNGLMTRVSDDGDEKIVYVEGTSDTLLRSSRRSTANKRQGRTRSSRGKSSTDYLQRIDAMEE